MVGETIPLDLMPASKGRMGITRRFPIGPIAGDQPVQLPAQPRRPQGRPGDRRRATRSSSSRRPRTRSSMLTVAEIIEEAGAPAGAVSILPMSRELGDRMVSDERFKLLTFTGSPSVGWRMKERAGKKKVVLELGGNAGVIVDKTADLDWAVKRCLVGAFAYAGQVCISVQRMFIHEDIWDAFMDEVRRRRPGPQARRPARPADRRRADGRRQRRVADPALGRRGARGRRQGAPRRHGRRHVLPADDPDRRAGHRRGLLERGVRAARRRVPVPRLRRRDPPGQRLDVRAPDRASSRTTSATPGGRSTSSRSAA